MASREPDASPIEAAAAATDDRITQVFSLLGNETRLAIILALAEASEPLNRETWNPSGANSVPFSDLRERTGARDPGNFNYHLGKLEGEFVRRTTDGYELLPAGSRIVKTVVSIAGFEETAHPPTAIDLACPNCGAETAITHQRQRLYHVCTGCEGNVVVDDRHPSGILSGVMVDRSVLVNRSPEEVVSAQYAWKFYSFALALEGVCVMCSGPIEGSLHVCEEHEADADGLCRSCGFTYEVTGQFACTVCDHTSLWGIVPLSAIHPAGIAFCWEHGIDLGFRDHGLETLQRLFDLYRGATLDVRSLEPPRVGVTLRDGDDELRVTFDRNLDVVDVSG